MKTLQSKELTSRPPLRRAFFLIAVLVGCFALSLPARVVFLPDGGYPGGDTAVQIIENLFAISPNGGSGLLEGCLIAVPLGVLVVRAVLKTCNQSWRYLYRRTTQVAFPSEQFEADNS